MIPPGLPGYAAKSPAFRSALSALAARIGAEDAHLAAVISFESGFRSSAVNSVSGATGLIQFLPSTAQALGTTTDALAKMSDVAQLEYVERYYKPFAGRLGTLQDAYTAVLDGRVGLAPDAVLFKGGTKAYDQNRRLDLNADGVITAEEATAAGPGALLARATAAAPALAALSPPVAGGGFVLAAAAYAALYYLLR